MAQIRRRGIQPTGESNGEEHLYVDDACFSGVWCDRALGSGGPPAGAGEGPCGLSFRLFHGQRPWPGADPFRHQCRWIQLQSPEREQAHTRFENRQLYRRSARSPHLACRGRRDLLYGGHGPVRAGYGMEQLCPGPDEVHGSGALEVHGGEHPRDLSGRIRQGPSRVGAADRLRSPGRQVYGLFLDEAGTRSGHDLLRLCERGFHRIRSRTQTALLSARREQHPGLHRWRHHLQRRQVPSVLQSGRWRSGNQAGHLGSIDLRLHVARPEPDGSVTQPCGGLLHIQTESSRRMDFDVRCVHSGPLSIHQEQRSAGLRSHRR